MKSNLFFVSFEQMNNVTNNTFFVVTFDLSVSRIHTYYICLYMQGQENTLTPCLSALDFRIMDFGVYFKLGKNRVQNQMDFFSSLKSELFSKLLGQGRFFFHEFSHFITLFVYYGLTFVNTLTQKNGFQKSISESNLIFCILNSDFCS